MGCGRASQWWDGSTLRLIPVSYSEGDSLRLNRSGQTVWQASRRIQWWTGSELVSLTDVNQGRDPQINDAGQIVWSHGEGGNAEIYLDTPTGPGSLDLLTPQPVTEGDPATGLVKLRAPAPAGGAVVTLTSANPAAASVPASVIVPARARPSRCEPSGSVFQPR